MLGALHDGKSQDPWRVLVVVRKKVACRHPHRKSLVTPLEELGVKTMDNKGNTRPIFTILKEIQASFKRNKPGIVQKAEYMKTIFGEEASLLPAY